MKEQVDSLLKRIGLKSVEIKLEEMKLDDGVTVLEAEVFEAGQPVNVKTEDGQLIPVPVGEYALEDGMVLVVAEEGMIAEIKEAVTEEEAPVEEEQPVAASEKPAETPLPKSIIESQSKEYKFEKMESELKELKELVVELSAKLSEEKKEEVKDEVELAKPIVHNPERKAKETVTFSAKNPLEKFFNIVNK